MPAGGLAPDGSRWVPCRPDFFLPVRVLSRRFRRLYLDGLKKLYGQGELNLSGRCQNLAEPKSWRRLLSDLRDKEWVVYAKEPCDSTHVLKYLSRYVYRVAISNHRLVALEDGEVTFRYKDYKRGRQLRTCTLKAVEFLRRLMLHVLPKGLHKVRYFGLMANRHRSQKLAHCRTLLDQAASATQASEMSEPNPIQADELAGVRVHSGDLCPVCGQGRMQLVKAYYRHRAAWDLSTAIPDMDTS